MAICAALTLGLTTPAAEAQTGRFEGGGTIYNFNDVCQNAGWTFVPERVTARYHPANVGNNGNDESISFFTPTSGQSYVRRGGNIPTTYVPVDHGGAFRTPYFIRADQGLVSMRITQRSPSALTNSTFVPVRVRGRIRGWSGIEGCVAHFEVSVFQRR